jgi:group I intron endonuclease
MSKFKIAGIYKISCTQNNKYYYGSSVDILSRWHSHRKSLRKKLHHNKILQNVWNKYGEESFVFEIIEEGRIEDLKDIEDIYLKEHVRNIDCVNIMTSSNNVPNNIGFSGHSHTKETKNKIKNNMMGRKHSKETKLKISESNKGHYAKSGNEHHFYGKIREEFSLNHHMKDEAIRLKNAIAHGAVSVVIISPVGEEYLLINKSEFSRTHKLNRNSLRNLISGKIFEYKGWKLKQ